jgi:FlaA1/EpsC-like NDP-sugar epimerase
VIPSLKALNWRGFLARPPLPSPPPEALDALLRQPILITGAGGSIGSALARRLAALAPPHLLLLEASEANLYTLQREWAASGLACPITTILGNAADHALVEHIFSVHAPRIVFHAAAYKHVPLMEEHPLAAIANNIYATGILTHGAAAHRARVILLSTDKAVQPSSVMGATKRVAEQIVLAARGTVLRLGNVLASRDSVAEIFARQIAHGGPITVTDPAARRYFLTLDEAVDLLLFAAAHPEPSALLAPVLPSTHFIADLGHFMARELAPGHNIAIQFTEPRPGDKETELLWSPGDPTHPISPYAPPNSSPAAMVSIQSASFSGPQLAAGLASLRTSLDAHDLAGALANLRSLVPDFTPSHAVLSQSRQDSARVSR